MQGQSELLQVVCTLDAPRRLTRGLHRGQEERDQDSDDRDHDQELDQRETSPPGAATGAAHSGKTAPGAPARLCVTIHFAYYPIEAPDYSVGY